MSDVIIWADANKTASTEDLQSLHKPSESIYMEHMCKAPEVLPLF